MVRLVITHGRDNAYEVPEIMSEPFEKAVRSGLSRLEVPYANSIPVDFAFYGDVWREDSADLERGGEERRAMEGASEQEVRDLQIAVARQILEASLGPGITGETERLGWDTLGQAIAALESRLPVGIAQFVLTKFAADTAEYFARPELRYRALQLLLDAVRAHGDEVVLLAHSMGTILSYDLLMAHHDLPVLALITFGSPLGLRAIRAGVANVHRETPFPPTLPRWVNVYNKEDLIAAVQELAPLFPSGDDRRVDDVNARKGKSPGLGNKLFAAHDPYVYLRSVAVARAIDSAVADRFWSGTTSPGTGAIGSPGGFLNGDIVDNAGGQGGPGLPGVGYVPNYPATYGAACAGYATLNCPDAATLTGCGVLPDDFDYEAPPYGGTEATTEAADRERVWPEDEAAEPATGDRTDVEMANGGGAGAERGETSAEPVTQRRVKRTASADFPGRVDSASENLLQYSIASEATYGYTADLDIAVPAHVKELPIRVTVQASDFEVLDPDTGKSRNSQLATLDLESGEPVGGEFLLRARKTQQDFNARIHVRFSYKGLPVGRISILTTIVANEVSIDADLAPARAETTGDTVRTAAASTHPGVPALAFSSVPPGNGGGNGGGNGNGGGGGGGGGTISIDPSMVAASPDYVIYVDDRGDGNFEISLGRNIRPKPFPLKSMGMFPTRGNAWAYAQSKLEQFRLSREFKTPEQRRNRVEGLGRALWNELPDPFKDHYWREMHGRQLSLAIYSEEPYVPWELIIPHGAGGIEAPMLGLAFSIGRWRQEREYYDSFAVSGFRVVAPVYETDPLQEAQSEATELEKKYAARRVQGTYDDVVGLLKSSGYQVLHFSGHGRFDPKDGLESWIKLANGQLIPSDVQTANVGYTDHPLVFFNACEVGKETWTLTQIGGWADTFCDVGFSAFVGPYWAVNDKVARLAALLFYDELRKQKTVGEAMQAIRRQFWENTEHPAHPTWLAYSLHCHPNVKVQFA